jgi:hypothetical protein
MDPVAKRLFRISDPCDTDSTDSLLSFNSLYKINMLQLGRTATLLYTTVFSFPYRYLDTVRVVTGTELPAPGCLQHTVTKGRITCIIVWNRNDVSFMGPVVVPGPMGALDPDPDSQSGSRKAKLTHKK